MKQRMVLLLSHQGDFYTIDRVERAVSQKGFCPFRFNTEAFPQDIRLSLGFKQGETQLVYQDGTGEHTIYSSDIYSVWVRKIVSPRIDPGMDPLLRTGSIREASETLGIFLNELDNGSVRWIDRLPLTRQAENKFFQLKTAGAVGMRTPGTIITNDPKQVLDFYHRLNGHVVTKMLTPLTMSMSGNTPFVYTSRVKPEDLEALESLKYCPMVFQEYIEKSHELRIAYVDGQLFTGSIRLTGSNNLKINVTDWRDPKGGKGRWEHYQVHDDFANKTRDFMKAIGLYFGAIDVIVQPDGEYVFLEVNPSGEWGMLERDLGLPIANAIAEALVK